MFNLGYFNNPFGNVKTTSKRKKRHAFKQKSDPLSDHQKQVKIFSNQGLKAFEIDGRIVYALNYKNAMRKAKK